MHAMWSNASRCCRNVGVEYSDASEGLDLRDANNVRINDIEATVPEGWGRPLVQYCGVTFASGVQ